MLRREHKHKWLVLRTIWPYPYGYGVYCKGCKTIANSGLDKVKAEQIAIELGLQGEEPK